MDTPQQEKKEMSVQSFIRFAITVIVIVVLFRMFIAQPFVVSGESMHPTFDHANYLIVDEISYRFKEPHRGDVVIFRPPLQTHTYYIKRIIGLPGDTLSVTDGIITITNESNPDGFTLEEPYVKDLTADSYTVFVEEGTYFVLGDNRGNSFDSRRWGLLPEDKIIGKAWARLFPFNRFGLNPGLEDVTY